MPYTTPTQVISSETDHLVVVVTELANLLEGAYTFSMEYLLLFLALALVLAALAL